MGKILVADDEAEILNLFNISLTRGGHEVIACSDGSKALETLRSTSVDVVITDIAMPGVDGIEFLKQIRTFDLDVPVIVITGGPLIETAIKAVEYGAFRYMVKPVPLKELNTLVCRAIDLHNLAKLKREALSLSGSQHKWAGDLATLESKFEKGLRSLWIAFQPIVALTDQRIYAYEVLLRTTEKSFASPPLFFEAAERLNRVWDLSRIIRDRVALSADRAPDGICFFVNLHPEDLEDEQLYRSDTKLAKIANRVVLEITEQIALEHIRDLSKRAKLLKSLGYRLALDDLGAGYAGLTNVANLEPDVVKLDLALIRGVDQIQTKQRVIGSIIRLCNDLHIQVICEGVETNEELRKLIELGGQLFQGYFFAGPSQDFVPSDFVAEMPKMNI